MDAVRASGYTTVILWTLHINSNADLIFDSPLLVSNGVYVGASTWPAQLATLKQAPTSVNRIEVCVGSAGPNDFATIKTLIAQSGTGSGTTLYKNFVALKAATGADAIDFDDEQEYDVTSMVQFAQMLSTIGYKVTLCPYTNTSFWQTVKSQLGSIVDRVYLQCYEGGAGNNPATWNTLFGGLKVMPGLESPNSTFAQVQSKMSSWESVNGVPGGFMWYYDSMATLDMPKYAQAILYGPTVLPPPVGGLTATVTGNSTTLNWNAPVGSYITGYKVKRATVSGGPYTTLAANVTSTTYQDNTITAGTTYYYVVTAVDSIGEGPNSAQLVVSESYDTALPLLTPGSTVIGTPGSWNNVGDTVVKAFDNDISTFFNGPVADGDWTGLDLGNGSLKVVTSIRYCPRATLASRMVGGVFQGSNTADFSSGNATLFTVTATPPDNIYTTAAISTNLGSYRYLRYLAPLGAWGNVSEVKFYGVSIPAAPAGVTVAMKDGTGSLNWNAVATALKYNVKRATASGGPYTTVGPNVTSLSFQDTGLTAATTYYYVISAINEAGEGANSTQVTAIDAYSQWLVQKGFTPGAANTGFGQDANHNGISNGVEYMVPAGLGVVPGASNSTIMAIVRQDAQVTATLGYSTDLASWTQVSFPAAADQSGVPAGFVRLQLQDPMSPGVPKKFYRIKATR